MSGAGLLTKGIALVGRSSAEMGACRARHKNPAIAGALGVELAGLEPAPARVAGYVPTELLALACWNALTSLSVLDAFGKTSSID